jgi:hypothetical protein
LWIVNELHLLDLCSRLHALDSACVYVGVFRSPCPSSLPLSHDHASIRSYPALYVNRGTASAVGPYCLVLSNAFPSINTSSPLLTFRITRLSQHPMPHSDHSPSPSPDTFPDLPAFPDNVSTAPLLCIALEKLLNHDDEEHDRCWKACCDLGFFYLDLRTSKEQSIDGNALLRDADSLFEVMKGFYDLDVQEKVKYDFKDQGSYFGYKGYGEGVMDEDGTRDRNEFYNVRFAHLPSTQAKPVVNMYRRRSQKTTSST